MATNRLIMAGAEAAVERDVSSSSTSQQLVHLPTRGQSERQRRVAMQREQQRRVFRADYG